jgi:molecular chaperone DnaK
MPRATVDFGIDLGTTNSAIAQLRGTDVHVFKDNEGWEYTPSAVWIDQRGQLFVGRRAKERLESDQGNAFCEFKLKMGTPEEYRFARSGQTMQPEQLSAEVLKALRGIVRQRAQEEISAAVITVPAAFELHQCNATRKAAELAGFTLSPLLQEPIAAALAYGFQSESDRVFWLVYDLGGGTFDAAVMRVRDGEIQVVNHGGDNYLGGKLIDWDIVNELFIPALTRTARLSDFRRGNPKWAGAIAKLKQQAEQGKIRTSVDQSVDIYIEFLCNDDSGHPVSFEYELQRSEVERLAAPYILRSINVCKKTLEEKGLKVGDIEKVLLVGGPTLMPHLRERLEDKRAGLGIPLEFRLDPLTVVAQGAAIFAGTQRLVQKESTLASRVQEGNFLISFPQWTFTGSDTETSVAGIIKGPGGMSLQNFTLEFLQQQVAPHWRSGQMRLPASGKFLTTLVISKGGTNRFLPELRDSMGRLLPVVTDPPELTYTPGIVIGGAPLTHSVGVGLANNEVAWFLEKGTPLPAVGRRTLRTVFEVRQGQAGDVIRIPVLEGESPRADRNRVIGMLEVNAQQVRRNLPVGAEVEVTINLDESRILTTSAFIDLLAEEFKEVIQLGKQQIIDASRLQASLEEEKRRLAGLQASKDMTVRQRVQQIDQERKVHQVEVALAAARVEPEALDKADRLLLDLKIAIDEVQQQGELPELIDEAEKLLVATRELIDKFGTPERRSSFARAESELRSAIQSGDADLLQQRIEAMRGLGIRVLDEVGLLPRWLFEELMKMQDKMKDPVLAARLIREGQVALRAENLDGLRAINQQLIALVDRPPDLSSLGGTLGI